MRKLATFVWPSFVKTGAILAIGLGFVAHSSAAVYVTYLNGGTGATLTYTQPPGAPTAFGALGDGVEPYGVAVDSSGIVYTADYGSHLLSAYAPTAVSGTAPIGSTTVNTLSPSNPLTGLAVSGNTLYVSNFGGAIDRYTATNSGGSVTFMPDPAPGQPIAGQSPATFAVTNGLSGTIGIAPQQPIGLAVSRDGSTLFVADDANGLEAFNTATGAYITGVNAAGIAGVAVDASGNVYFDNLSSNALDKVTFNGLAFGTPTAISISGVTLSTPDLMNFDPTNGELAIANIGSNAVDEINVSTGAGSLYTTYPSLSSLVGVAFSPAVPEPCSMALLTVGGLSLLRRRRIQAAS